MNRNKAKGTRGEHRVIAWLTKRGYACTRAAGSLGIFDIVAVGRDDVLLIQVKTGRRCRVSTAERRALEAVPVPGRCARKEIWRLFPRRTPAIEAVP